MSNDYDDETLLDFLHTLDDSEVEVTEWESKFIAGNMDATGFTTRQRQAIEEMIQKYGKRIGWL